MNKKETQEVMELYTECPKLLYAKAGIEVLDEFDPEVEAKRIADAIHGYDR